MGDMIEKSGTYPIDETDLYCPGCGRWIGAYGIIWGWAKFPCRNCKKITRVGVTPEDESDQEDIEAAVRSGDTFSMVTEKTRKKPKVKPLLPPVDNEAPA